MASMAAMGRREFSPPQSEETAALTEASGAAKATGRANRPIAKNRENLITTTYPVSGANNLN
jgi:hypothetical protein